MVLSVAAPWLPFEPTVRVRMLSLSRHLPSHGPLAGTTKHGFLSLTAVRSPLLLRPSVGVWEESLVWVLLCLDLAGGRGVVWGQQEVFGGLLWFRLMLLPLCCLGG